MQALLKVFPPGASRSHAELAVVQAIVDLAQGHLDETAAHLATAESYAQQASPERRRRLGVAIASLRLWLARRRGDHPGAIKQAAVLTAAFAAQPDTDVALSSDLWALTLMNLGKAPG
jgi:LuxR family transcriptional regulator, maltose regulon positive regulatory protein